MKLPGPRTWTKSSSEAAVELGGEVARSGAADRQVEINGTFLVDELPRPPQGRFGRIDALVKERGIRGTGVTGRSSRRSDTRGFSQNVSGPLRPPSCQRSSSCASAPRGTATS